MLNVSGGRYVALQVWSGTKYINIAEALSGLSGLDNQIEADDTRIAALEDNIMSLAEQKQTSLLPCHLCF